MEEEECMFVSRLDPSRVVTETCALEMSSRRKLRTCVSYYKQSMVGGRGIQDGAYL